jgi:hypothetical protein
MTSNRVDARLRSSPGDESRGAEVTVDAATDGETH